MNAASESLLAQMLAEQKKTNELLVMLIEAMAEDGMDEDGESEPSMYMDGTPIG